MAGMVPYSPIFGFSGDSMSAVASCSKRCTAASSAMRAAVRRDSERRVRYLGGDSGPFGRPEAKQIE